MTMCNIACNSKHDASTVRDETTRLTVVIPTRERCDTLESALRTCVAQDYGNAEILVSDNFSQDNTREITASFRDPRIKYVNTGKRVSMSQNWEFALQHISGDYVTFLGDDDGLLPGALPKLSQMIQESTSEAIVWSKAEYLWPDYIYETYRNLLQIPLGNAMIRYIAKEQLKKVISFRASYQTLPCLYNGVVSRAAIERIRCQSGRFFHSMIPDVYSAIVLACEIEDYYYSSRPFSISGASRHSGGSSFFNPQKESHASQLFLSEGDIPFHKKLVMAPSAPLMVAESLFQAQDHVEKAKGLDLDMKELFKHMLREAASRPEICNVIAQAVRQIGAIHDMSDYVEHELNIAKATSDHRSSSSEHREEKPLSGHDILRKRFILSCDDFGVKNVYDASGLCANILALYEGGYFHPVRMTERAMTIILKLVTDRIGQLKRRVVG